MPISELLKSLACLVSNNFSNTFYRPVIVDIPAHRADSWPRRHVCRCSIQYHQAIREGRGSIQRCCTRLVLRMRSVTAHTKFLRYGVKERQLMNFDSTMTAAATLDTLTQNS